MDVLNNINFDRSFSRNFSTQDSQEKELTNRNNSDSSSNLLVRSKSMVSYWLLRI